LPVANPASFSFDVGASAVSFLQKISLARDAAWLPLAPPAPGPMMAVSVWPNGFEAARASSVSGRFQFPALGPHALDAADSMATDNLKAWASKTPFDGETRGAVAVNEIQRLLESLPEENAPPPDEGAIKPVATMPRSPIINAVIPHGAFP
jgi:hypothetical protein